MEFWGNSCDRHSGTSIWQATVASGISGSVVVTHTAGGLDAVCAAVGFFTGLSSSTATNVATPTAFGFAATPFALGSSLPVSAGGFGIVGFSVNNITVTPGTITWTGATEDAGTAAFLVTGNGKFIEFAQSSTTSTPTVTACASSCSFQGLAMVGASWR